MSQATNDGACVYLQLHRCFCDCSDHLTALTVTRRASRRCGTESFAALRYFAHCKQGWWPKHSEQPQDSLHLIAPDFDRVFACDFRVRIDKTSCLRLRSQIQSVLGHQRYPSLPPNVIEFQFCFGTFNRHGLVRWAAKRNVVAIIFGERPAGKTFCNVLFISGVDVGGFS